MWGIFESVVAVDVVVVVVLGERERGGVECCLVKCEENGMEVRVR